MGVNRVGAKIISDMVFVRELFVARERINYLYRDFIPCCSSMSKEERTTRMPRSSDGLNCGMSKPACLSILTCSLTRRGPL